MVSHHLTVKTGLINPQSGDIQPGAGDIFGEQKFTPYEGARLRT